MPGEAVESFPGEAEGGPFVHGTGAFRFVEFNGRRVPIEHAPFHATAPTLGGDCGELLQQCLADSLATKFR